MFNQENSSSIMLYAYNFILPSNKLKPIMFKNSGYYSEPNTSYEVLNVILFSFLIDFPVCDLKANLHGPLWSSTVFDSTKLKQ